MEDKLRIWLYLQSGLERAPETAKEYNEIISLIYDTTGHDIGINTLKRFYNHWDSDTKTKISKQTKSLFCKALGYNSWEELEIDMENRDTPVLPSDSDASAFTKTTTTSLLFSMLRVGEFIWVNYGCQRNKILQLEFLGNHQYRVASAANCKLEHNDVLTIYALLEGIRFIATKVVRNGTLKGTYHSGSKDLINLVTKSERQAKQYGLS